MEEEKKKLTLEVLSEEHKKLKALAALEGKSIKEIVLFALDKAFLNWRK